VSPIVAALDHLEVDHDAVTTTPMAEAVMLSLVEALSQVPDPRKSRGVRHGVLAVLLLAACAVLTGARSFATVAEYAHDAGHAVLAALGVGAVVPHESTIRRILQKVDASALKAAFRSWALAQLGAQPPPVDMPQREQRRMLALDGKTLRGAHVRAGTDDANPTSYQPHLVSVLHQATGAVLGQVQVDAKGSDVSQPSNRGALHLSVQFCLPRESSRIRATRHRRRRSFRNGRRPIDAPCAVGSPWSESALVAPRSARPRVRSRQSPGDFSTHVS
jgi:urease gamma subunit